MTGMAYGMVLAVNIKAAREDQNLSEDDLAERMRNLGYSTWLQQTVASAELGEYSLAAEEVLGISVALYASVTALMLPDDDPLAVALPSGQIVTLRRHHFEPSVWWYGNTPTTIPQPYEKTRHD